MSVDTYELGVETPEVSALFSGSYAVSLALYDRSETGSPTPIAITTTCTQIGSTGIFKWSGSKFTAPPTSGRNKFIYIMTEATTGLTRVGAFDWRDFNEKFGGEVHIDTVAGTAGTAYPTGTQFQPVSNIADALTIAARIGTKRLYAEGSITLASSFAGWTISGSSSSSLTVALANQNVAGASFSHATLTGQMNGAITGSFVRLDGVTDAEGYAYECNLVTSLSIKAGGELERSGQRR